MNELYIDTPNGRIVLDYMQEHSLRNQMRVQDAINTLECMGCTNISALSEDQLLELGLNLEDAIYDNIGDVEYAVVCDYNDFYNNLLQFED